MATRVQHELEEYAISKDLAAVHGETVRNYMEIKQMMMGAMHFLERIGFPVKGVAADMGSGTGVVASILSKQNQIDKVYAIEYSSHMVVSLMPFVFSHFGAHVQKIQRVIGDFNNIQLPKDSIDLVAEVDSYHHSEDLELSAREAWGVLRHGGVVIAIDRAWPDSTSQQDLDRMLDVEFSPKLKEKYGIPVEKKYTRRDFGEHEYTLRMWDDAFRSTGFDSVFLVQDHPRIPGANLILTRLPTFQWSIDRAVEKFKRGERFIKVYGWAPQKVTMIHLKHHKR